LRMRRQGFSRLTRCCPAFSPQMTYGLPSSRGMVCSNASAGALRWIAFRPVLLSGSMRHSCSSLTCSQRSVRISFRRAPVNVRRRMAAITHGEQLLSFSAGLSVAKPAAPVATPPSAATARDRPRGRHRLHRHYRLRWQSYWHRVGARHRAGNAEFTA
jgi:hypothetical protein